MYFSINPYLDPGSGSFIIQILIATLLGVGLAIRSYWGRIKERLTGKRRPVDENDDTDQP